MELKTVQVRDEIEVARPCIDSEDETYNCEWSQELRIDQSFDKYAKAWVLIHGLARARGLAQLPQLDPAEDFFRGRAWLARDEDRANLSARRMGEYRDEGRGSRTVRVVTTYPIVAV